ncbi:MAG: hypothetical protein ABH878_01860 [bacterium]
MGKSRILSLLLFNSLLLLWVPQRGQSAFDAPEAFPVSFALANLSSFPDYLLGENQWCVSTGGARLFSMPELQPFALYMRAPLLTGSLYFKGFGLNSGKYSEMISGIGYKYPLTQTVSAALEIHALQVAIEDYGTTWSGQANARLYWRILPNLEAAGVLVNFTGSTFGAGRYPLPRRMALGSKYIPMQNVQLFLEIEQETYHNMTARLGLGYTFLQSLTWMLGFQGDPDVLATGLSFAFSRLHATAGFQYHPDLGLSQCYGIAVAF